VNAVHYDVDDYATMLNVYLPRMGLTICRIVPICFIVCWRKRPLNQALVSFVSVCAFVGRFLLWLFWLKCPVFVGVLQSRDYMRRSCLKGL